MSQFPTPFVASTPLSTRPKYTPSILSPPMNDLCRESTSPSPRSLPPSPAPTQIERRVSKAKKGKRVHACEFPGCEKVFTRAEHRRRHELSHKFQKLYPCSHEGCTKAFHRSDYLSQHMARHEPEYPAKLSSSMRRNDPASVIASQQEQPFYKSSMLSGFQSPPPSIDLGTSSSPDQSINYASPSNYGCQHLTHNVVTSNSICNYPLNTSQTPLSQIGLGIGSETALNQYLRSILRPEAFLAPPQPQAQMDSSFWASLDPNLPLVNPLLFQDSKILSSWASAPDPMSTTITTNRLSCTPPPQLQ